jgi:hypothetical protein
MASIPFPLPAAVSDIAQFLAEELEVDRLDMSEGGRAALNGLLSRAAQKASVRWRNEDDFDGYVAALEEIERQFRRLISRAHIVAEYQTITEDIIEKVREWLCPFFCLC